MPDTANVAAVTAATYQRGTRPLPLVPHTVTWAVEALNLKALLACASALGAAAAAAAAAAAEMPALMRRRRRRPLPKAAAEAAAAFYGAVI